MYSLFIFTGVMCLLFSILLLSSGSFSSDFLLSVNLLSSSDIQLDMFVDYTSKVFIMVLLVIVGSVYLFASKYLVGDPFVHRFFVILSLFVGSMVCLIFFPHYLFVLMGYDGLGMISFLLVVYYGSTGSWVAGLKTFLINRLGDGFFMFGVVFLLFNGEQGLTKATFLGGMVSLVLVAGWFTKSAQHPFSSWLPAAMAAPTPVSALVHSSTLVTASVFILIRVGLNLHEQVLSCCVVLGLMTVFVASGSAILEWDSKKVVAFSTLSQLGLMVYSFGKGLVGLCFYHLISHAIFKALMFIVVGYLMLKNRHFQDLRHLNNLSSTNYFLFLVLLSSVLSLSGFPFLVGFYSKDLMMESYFVSKMVIGILFSGSLILTSWYGGRLLKFLLVDFSFSSFLKTKYSWFYFSIFPLWLLIFWFGKIKSFFFISLSFITLGSKVVICMCMATGFLLSYQNLGSKNKSPLLWWMHNMGFLKVLNTFSWVKYFSQLGNYFFLSFDLGVNMFFMSVLNLEEASDEVNTQLKVFSTLNMFYWFLVVLLLGFTLCIL